MNPTETRAWLARLSPEDAQKGRAAIKAAMAVTHEGSPNGCEACEWRALTEET